MAETIVDTLPVPHPPRSYQTVVPAARFEHQPSSPPVMGTAALTTAVTVIVPCRSDGLVAILQRRIAARRPLLQRQRRVRGDSGRTWN